jgi:AraC-like DNA-binding protein
MDERFLDIRDVAEIASYCTMSEFHFSRCFKEMYQISPHQYIIEKKMQLARNLLLQHKHTVSAIAQLCGFPDVFTFSKAFKKYHGVPPSLYSNGHASLKLEEAEKKEEE